MQREKLNIRLPSDPGPNPYDSKTKFEDLPANEWIFKLDWWIGVVLAGTIMGVVGWWKSNH